MNKSEFQELVWCGMGRAILYARDNDVEPFRDVILDACLHSHSVDALSEGTRSAYMYELLSHLSDRQFYFDEVLKALPGSGDDWDAVLRFFFASYLSEDGDERARPVMYESFEPGPRSGESIAVLFLEMDGLKGFLFVAAKIGGLLMTRPEEVDEGYLWSVATETCGEQEVKAALRQAGVADPRIETYRLTAETRACKPYGPTTSQAMSALSYEQLKGRLTGLRQFALRIWGKQAGTDDLEGAAHGLIAAEDPEDQVQHLRIFSERSFPLDLGPLLELSSSAHEYVALGACVALGLITHPSVRELAFRLVELRHPGREEAIAMLDQNWEPGDHELVLNWFESETDREVRHGMELDLRKFWEHHPQPSSEVRMLCLLYERGPCSFCRKFVVRRLIELDSLTESMRAECAFDANDEIRALVGMTD